MRPLKAFNLLRAVKKQLPAVLVTVISAMSSYTVIAETGGIDSLRTNKKLSEEAPAETMKKPLKKDGVMTRHFIQQPPLIPHSIRGYTVDKNVNTCLHCHSWKNASKWGATRISITHFYDRDWRQLADVAPNRYFCQQCHVPQADAEPLKGNTFEPVDSLKK